MTPEQLQDHRDAVAARHTALSAFAETVDPAPSESESQDHHADVYVEALFLRAFTAYEVDVEKLFLHYVTGGLSLHGKQASTYLRITDEDLARKLTRGGYRFLSWAKPQQIREIANNYIKDGWPIADMMSANSQVLTDCEGVRNRIAHDSIEARVNFNKVQRNLLQTERVFPITSGQFLRIRNARLKKLHLSHYLEVINGTLEAIFNPPK